MSYACDADTLVAADSNGDGALDEPEFRAYLSASCDDSAFEFASVGCQCLYFGYDDEDDFFADEPDSRPLPEGCVEDCSQVPLLPDYLASDFPGDVCRAVTRYYINAGCIPSPTQAPTASVAPTSPRSPALSPAFRPTLLAPAPVESGGGGGPAVAVLAAVVAALAALAAFQFIHARRVRKAYEGVIKEQARHIGKEQERREREARAKRKRMQKRPFLPVLASLDEDGEGGTLELTPTNALPDEALLRLKLKQPGGKSLKTYFATSVTIESVRELQEDSGEEEGGEGEEEHLLEAAR